MDISKKDLLSTYKLHTHNHTPLQVRCKYKTSDTPHNGTPYTHNYVIYITGRDCLVLLCSNIITECAQTVSTITVASHCNMFFTIKSTNKNQHIYGNMYQNQQLFDLRNLKTIK